MDRGLAKYKRVYAWYKLVNSFGQLSDHTTGYAGL